MPLTILLSILLKSDDFVLKINYALDNKIVIILELV